MERIRQREKGKHPERKRPITVRRLSPTEILQHMYPSDSHSDNWSKNDPATQKFMKDQVIGLNVGGVTCLFIDKDYHEGPISPIDQTTQSLIKSPKTTFVLAEYFEPDLRRHKLYNTSTNIFAHALADSPVMHTAEHLAEVCKKQDKPVLVTDIAHKPLYSLYDLLYSGTTNKPFASSVAGVTGTIASFVLGQPLLGSLLAAWSTNTIRTGIQRVHDFGIFNPDKITKFERLYPDLDQARRLFVAKGLEQKIKEMIAAHPDEEDKGTIVALYPKAHGRRIVDLLEHPKRIKDTIRDVLYRGMTPGLGHTIREYHSNPNYNPNVMNSGKEWNLISKRRIKILPRRPYTRPGTETN